MSAVYFTGNPLEKENGCRLAEYCQRGDMAERGTCCETLTHCQYPSVYLSAKMVVVENKHSLQRPLKMNVEI